MSENEPKGDRRWAEQLLARADEIAESVTEEFLERHPDWLERYGARARRRGIEDARYHLQFLAGALLAGSPDGFRRYAEWAAQMLAARGIEPRFLAENLRQVGEHAARVLEPREAELVQRYAQVGAEACSTAGEEGEGAGSTGPSGEKAVGQELLDEARGLYLDAALRGDRRGALGVVREAMRRGFGVREIYLGVLQEAQYEVGRLWAENRISVAIEHTATAVCQSVLVRLYEEIPSAVGRRGPAVVTGVEGERHQVGANMVADVLELDGWDVRFLGTDMPHQGIVEVVGEMEARLVGISGTMLFNLPSVAELIERIRGQDRNGSLRIMVGGGAFRTDPEAWRSVGADDWASDLERAVEVAQLPNRNP